MHTFALVTGHRASASSELNLGWSGGRTVVVVPTTGQTAAMLLYVLLDSSFGSFDSFVRWLRSCGGRKQGSRVCEREAVLSI